mmetsp:Transcript_32294/g.70691  ORF Transcript_32294/g.70691 Transcript_32294/m.70691 type:complete len:306 (-) Transcript_32294:1579-2496(-)
MRLKALSHGLHHLKYRHQQTGGLNKADLRNIHLPPGIVGPAQGHVAGRLHNGPLGPGLLAVPHKSSNTRPVARCEATRDRRVLGQASDRLLHCVVGAVVKGHPAAQMGKFDLRLIPASLRSCEAYPAVIQHHSILTALLIVSEVEACVGRWASSVLSEQPVQIEADTFLNSRLLQLSTIPDCEADSVQPRLVPANKASSPEQHGNGPLDLLLTHKPGQPADHLKGIDPPSPPSHVVLLLEPLHHDRVQFQAVGLPIIQDLHLSSTHEEHRVPNAILVRRDSVAFHDGIREFLVVEHRKLPGQVLL